MTVSLDRFAPPEAGPHPRVVGHCSWCEADIEAGAEVWEFDGMWYCDYDCLHEFVREQTTVRTATRLDQFFREDR